VIGYQTSKNFSLMLYIYMPIFHMVFTWNVNYGWSTVALSLQFRNKYAISIALRMETCWILNPLVLVNCGYGR